MVRSLMLRSALALVFFWAAGAMAQVDTRSAEIRIKAAFLYRFGDFVEWPQGAFARPDGAFVIGVLGAEDIAAELERVVADRKIQGRPVMVKRLRRGEPVAGMHMLFLGESESARSGEVLAAARGHPVLTVTEGANGLRSGSVINFVAVDEKVRFDVALAAAERSQLKISSRLLGVARKVVASS